MLRRWLPDHSRAPAALGFAALAAVVSLWLLSPGSRAGSALVRASYDWCQALDRRQLLHDSLVVIVYLDLESYRRENQNPLEPWDRALHAQLVRRLTRAGAREVVFDIIFDTPGRNPAADGELAEALRASGRVVLAGEMASSSHATEQSERVESLAFIPPIATLRDAAAGWGLANAAVDEDYVVRRIFRGFPDLNQPSLVAVAAKLVGVTNSHAGEMDWVKYYGRPMTIPHVSYSAALRPDELGDGFFRGKVVFVGARPMAGSFGERKDEFRSPLASWGSKDLFMPAVETHATQLLNLMRGDSLHRLPPWAEALTLALCAGFLCWMLFPVRPLPAAGLALAFEVAVIALVAFALPRLKIWFPWLLVGAFQVPTALMASVVCQSLEWFRERRRFEMQRRADEAKIREQAALIDKAQDAILTLDPLGRVTYVNPSAERLYGWTAADLAKSGAATHDFAPERIRQSVLAAGEWIGELQQKTRDGRDLIVSSRCTLIRDAAGAAKSLLFINTDITEKKRLEAEALRTQRLESVGALAAGMAHDLNNALAPVLMGVQLLQKRDQDQEIQRMLAVMEQNTHRGADMVRQVLMFARGHDSEKAPLALGTLLREMERMICQTFPKSINVAALVPNDLWPVLGNATQLHQALLNLCVNARDAMPRGGELTLAGDNVILTSEEAKQIPGAVPGSFVMLLVSDTGCGMSPALLSRVFEPFFTTKAAGKGTGLGLSTTARIISQHSGFLHVKSQLNRGTTFEIYLPCASIAPTPGSELGAAAEMARGQGEWILVVDDELSVREMICLALNAHGYRAVPAANGPEAAARCEEPDQRIALVLLDNDMPALTGAQTIPLLRARAPQLPIVLMSGEPETIHAAPDVGILAKPFPVHEMLAIVARQLAERR